MSERRLNALFNMVFRVDRSEQRDSLRSVQQLEKATDLLKQGLSEVDANADELVQGLKRIGEGRGEILATAERAKQAALESGLWSDELERAWQLLTRIGDRRQEIDAVGDALGNAADQAVRLQRGVNLEGRIERFDTVSRQVSLAGDFQSNLGALRGLSGAAGLGGAGRALDIGGELVVLAEELPRLKAALSGLPQTIGAAVSALGVGGVGLIGGIAALALVFNELAKQTQRVKEQTLEQLNAYRSVIEALATSTTDEARERANELDQQREVIVNTLRGLRDGLAEIEGEQDNVDKLGDLLGVAGGQADAYRENIKELNKELVGVESEMNGLNAALSANAFAANDAAEAMAKTREEFEAQQAAAQQRFLDILRQNAEFGTQIEQLAAAGDVSGLTGIQEGLASQRAALQREFDNLDTITRLAASGVAELPAPLEDITARMNELAASIGLIDDQLIRLDNIDISNLSGGVDAAVDILNKAREAIEAVSQERISQLSSQVQAEIALVNFQRTATIPTINSRIEALQTERNALESIVPELVELAKSSEAGATALAQTRSQLEGIDTQLAQLADIGKNAIADATADLASDLAQIASERDAAIAKIQTDAVNKQRELLRDLNDKLNELSSETTEKRLDAQREFNKESSDIEEDLAKERLQIERRAQRSITQAIGDRDALAAFQAKQQREEQLTDAEEAAEEQREELQENYREQLRIIETELRKQQQTLQAQYNAQLRDLQIATQNAVLQEQNKASQEIQVRQQAYQNEVDDLARHMIDYNNILANGLNSALSTVITWVNGINQAMGGLQLSSSSASLLAGLGGSGAQSFTQPQIESIFDNRFNNYLQVAGF